MIQYTCMTLKDLQMDLFFNQDIGGKKKLRLKAFRKVLSEQKGAPECPFLSFALCSPKVEIDLTPRGRIQTKAEDTTTP